MKTRFNQLLLPGNVHGDAVERPRADDGAAHGRDAPAEAVQADIKLAQDAFGAGVGEAGIREAGACQRTRDERDEQGL